MPTKQKEKPDADPEQQHRRKLRAAIGERVMQKLGRPDDLREVQVRRLWEENYRVNVVVGPDAASVRVAHSFFLLTDGEGNIITSNPRIGKCYPHAAEGSKDSVAVPPASV